MSASRRQPIVFDFETYKFGPGEMAPKPVCLSYAAEGVKGIVVGDDMATMLEAILDGVISGKYVVINFSIAFDFAVALQWMPRLWGKIWKAYRSGGGVLCSRVREKLLDIAEGVHGGERNHKGQMVKHLYDLGDVIRRRFKVELVKGDDSWRTRYRELEGVPLADWPKAAVDYSIQDSVWPLELYHQQQSRAHTMRYKLPDQFDQTFTDLTLRLMSATGMRTDGEAIDTLAKATEARMAELRYELQMEGLMRIPRVKRTGTMTKASKDTTKVRAMIERSFSGGAIPRTKPTDKHPTGQIKTDADTLEMCDEPIAAVLHEYTGLEKSASAFIDKLFAGVNAPIHPNFNVLVNSGRTSCSKPNLQQLPRVPGVRECCVPAPLVWLPNGKPSPTVFATCDYDSHELRCWAQICLDLLGDSTLARKYQNDPKFDPHLDFAAKMLGISYEEADKRYRAGDPVVTEYRQQTKPANFGFPVGMGYRKFRKYARGYGLVLDEDQARELRANWYIQWPEAEPYFAEINRIVGNAGVGTVIQLRSGRVRGMCRYTVAANTFFQGLASDGAKAALRVVTYECYNDKTSPLYGCRPVILMHDEIMLIAPEAYAAEAAARLEVVMIEAQSRYTPDVPVGATSTIMRRWRKGAKPTYNAAGRLIPYEDAPKKAA